MPSPAGTDARVHAASVSQDEGYAIGFVVFDDARQPIALGGWRVSATDRDAAVAKAAIAGLHHAPVAGDITLHARPTVRWRGTRRFDRLASVTTATVKPAEPREPEQALARGVARAGFQTRLLYRTSYSDAPTSPVRVYADGSERSLTGTTTASYGIVDDRGRILAAEAKKLSPDTGYLAGEFRGLATGVSTAATIGAESIHAITDNRRVVAVLSGEESPPAGAVGASRDARRVFAAVADASGIELADIHETNRRYNQFADAFADYGHHREVSLVAGFETPISRW